MATRGLILGGLFCYVFIDPSIGSYFTRVLSWSWQRSKPPSRRMIMQKNVNQEDWVAMFREIGLDDEAMKKWHQLFESRHPQGHAGFLNWLGLSSDEITSIRNM